MERDAIRSHVREVLLKRLALGASVPSEKAPVPAVATPAWKRFDDAVDYRNRALISEDDVLRARAAARPLVVPPGAIMTPLAREACQRFGVEVTAEAPTPTRPPAPATTAGPGASPAPSVKSPASPAAARVAAPQGVSQPLRLAIASDHGGFPLKQSLQKWLQSELGYSVVDLGTNSTEAVDYPDFAHRAAGMIERGEVDRAVIVDAAGLGSAMAANRHAGVRAAPCSTILEAVSTREHNDANVLCLGGRHLGEDAARAIVRVFLGTAFGGGRHLRRVQKIEVT